MNSLVAAYDSEGSDSEDDQQKPQIKPDSGLKSEAQTATVPSSGSRPGLFGSLPKPKSNPPSSSSSSSSLPDNSNNNNNSNKRKRVQIILNELPTVNPNSSKKGGAGDEDNDGETKANKGGVGLFAFLPKPKNPSTSSTSSKPSTSNHNQTHTVHDEIIDEEVANIDDNNDDDNKAKGSNTMFMPRSIASKKKDLQSKPTSEESFFTFDVPKNSEPLTSSSYLSSIAPIKSNIIPTFDDEQPAHQPQPQHDPQPDTAQYYQYPPQGYHDPSQYYYETSSESQSHQQSISSEYLNESALAQLGHRAKNGGGNVVIKDISLDEQMGGDAWRLEQTKNLSREKTSSDAYEVRYTKALKLIESSNLFLIIYSI
jgi:hypothetical protein